MGRNTTVRAVRTASVIIIMCLIVLAALFIHYFVVDFILEDMRAGNGIFDDKKMPNAAWIIENISYLLPVVFFAALQALFYCRKKDKDAYCYLERGIQAAALTAFIFCILLPIIINYGKGLEALSAEALEEKTPAISFENIGEKLIRLLEATVKDKESEKYINYNDAITRWSLDSISKILDPKIINGVIMWFGRQIVPCILLIAYNILRFDALKNPTPDCGADEEFDADEEDLAYENRLSEKAKDEICSKLFRRKNDDPSDGNEKNSDDIRTEEKQREADARTDADNAETSQAKAPSEKSQNSGKNMKKTDKKKK